MFFDEDEFTILDFAIISEFEHEAAEAALDDGEQPDTHALDETAADDANADNRDYLKE